ncbi:MAG TPA: mercuric transport protein MerTP [Candidatus Dojkabacteria bacterium]|jgi:copper chaperone CopZ|nr:mercuric transport protein MerTP [Candidatus Dojkabacteria bacterium]
MTTTTKNNKSFIAGLVTATAASLCCITPVLAFLGGASGLASSVSWIEPFRPYLIGLTVLVFAFAWYQKLKPHKQVDCNCETDNKKPFTQSKTFLGIVTVVAGLLVAFPYYAKAFYPKPAQVQAIVDSKSDIKQATFKIKGMSCEGCIEEVNSKIAKVNGVVNYQTSFEKANSIVTFDNNKTSVDSISSAISSTGYKIVSQTVINK